MARKNKDVIPVDRNIIDANVEEVMPDNYLPYAVEVAKDRALPDVRDGLKPVHRRILYGAYQLKALPDKPYYKSARIVGDILGKFHPHGDSSVYDAMVIMAQDFSTKEPLFQGHGNFGSIDGDSAAAMRYTEARLSNIALEMLKDIDKNTVDFVPNYSDSDVEPVVLPSRYPNLLVNGSFGIAVGLSTNIPPHNLSETIDATCALIDEPNLTTKELMNYVKGPDLPTGGELIGKQSLLSAYETGEGKVVLRSKAKVEKLDTGRLGIVITEFPYRKNKAKLLQTISNLTGDKRHQKSLESISDIRDESDRTGIRAVIELKKSADKETADKVLKYLMKHTDLQVNLNFNMVAIANGKPETLGLKNMLTHYINHQKSVIRRRTQTELEEAEKRFHIVEGFIKAINILDDVIATIRASKSKVDSKNNLVEKFGFTEIQAESIVTLMLYRLTGLELGAFEKEFKELTKKIKKLKDILNKESVLLSLLKEELLDIKGKYGSERKTIIIENEDEGKIVVEEIIVDEDVVVTQSKFGFIKRIPVKSYNRSSGNIDEIDNREDDYTRFVYNANTKDVVLMFTSSGEMYQTKVINIPEMKWKEKGIRIGELIKAKGLNEDSIIYATPVTNFTENKDIIIVTKQGGYKRVPLSKLETRNTKRVATALKKEDEIVTILFVDRENTDINFNVTTNKGFSFSFNTAGVGNSEISTLPQMLITLFPNDYITHVELQENVVKENFNITIDNKSFIKMCDKNTGKAINIMADDMVVAVTSDGCVAAIPAQLMVGMNELDLNNILEKKVVAVSVVAKSQVNSHGVYFFSSKGNVKKVKLSEFTDSLLSCGYKLRDKEEIVSAGIGKLEYSDVIIVTKNKMCLRFNDSAFSSSGRLAMGVNGIKLKASDIVDYGIVLGEEEIIENTILNKKIYDDLKNVEPRNKSTMGISLINNNVEQLSWK